MSNLDLTISDIFHGDTPVLKIMKGDVKKWPSGDIAIVLVNVDHATCSIGTSRIALHSAFSETLLPETSCIMTSVSISMGGVDITSTAYDSSDGSLTIADVTDDIIITATAVEVITFEDANVKTICVNNWGGNVIPGEITPFEAALVTTLADKFYANKTITKFNELRYFTGLTTLYSRIVSSYSAGQFYDCDALTEVTIPAAPIKNIEGAFRGCGGLIQHVDFSPITSSTINVSCVIRDSNVRKITLPNASISGGCYYMARNSSITTIDFGTSNWRNATNLSPNAFALSSGLQNIQGNPTNFYVDISR